MSHFAVLVTKTQERDVESQLERFYEQGDENDYFMEKQIEVAAEDVETEATNLLAERVGKEGVDSGLAVRYQQYIDEGDFKAVVQEWYGGNWDDDGNLYYLSNPDAQWDWYEVGGRWDGLLQLKESSQSEQVLSRHYSETDADVEERLREHLSSVAKVRDIDWEKTETTFAILHNDEWIERGEMGWFGMASNEKPEDDWDKEFKRIIESLDPEDEVTVVDCHI